MGVFDQVAGFIQGEGVAVPTEQIAGGFFSGIKYLLMVGVAFLIGVMIYKLQIQYNIKVMLRFYRGGKLIKVKFDRGREFTDNQGKKKIKLWGLRKTTPSVEQRYRYVIGKKEFMEFAVDDNSELHPMESFFEMMEKKKKVAQEDLLTDKQISRKRKDLERECKAESKGKTKEEKAEIKGKYKGMLNDYLGELIEVPTTKGGVRIVPQERIGWMLQESRILEEKIRSKNRVTELLRVALPYATLAICFLMVYFATKHISGTAAGVGSALGQIAQNCLGGG